MSGVRSGPAVALPAAMPGIPLVAIARLLRRRAWLVLLLGALGAVGAYAYARTLPKSFTASTLIAVAGSGFALPELQGALRPENTADPMPIVRTEMQALTSRDLVLQVVEDLKLAAVPEFNGELRAPTVLARLKAWVQSLLSGPAAAPGASDPLPGVVGAVTGGIRIFQDNRSLAIDVGFVSEDPARSALIANTLVSDYMAIRARRQASANTGASTVMTGRIDDVKAEIAGLQKQIDAMRERGEIVSLRAGSVSQQQLEDLVTAAAKATGERGQLEAVYGRAQALAAQGAPADLAGVLASPTISTLRDREAAASAKVAELSSRYGPGYPAVQAASADLASTRAQLAAETRRIVSSMGAQVRVAREHEAEIAAQLDAARRQALLSESGTAKLKQLQDEVEARQKLYQTLLERSQQITGEPNQTRLPDVYVIAKAAPPTSPSAPNMKLAAGFGGVAGMSFGCALALLGLRTKRRAVAPAGDVVAGLVVAGSLSDALLARARAGTLGPADLVAVGTAVRNLRAPVVAVVGAGAADRDRVAGAGHAWAAAAAAQGQRVAVIDTDVAGPPRAAPVPGPREDLVAALTGQGWPDAAEDAPFRLYAAGAAAPAVRGLLAGPVFGNLVAQAADGAELVVLLVPDAAGIEPLLRHAGAGLLVVPPGRPGAAAQALGARLPGLVPGPVGALVAGA